jgi:hypothetical protein
MQTHTHPGRAPASAGPVMGQPGPVGRPMLATGDGHASAHYASRGADDPTARHAPVEAAQHRAAEEAAFRAEQHRQRVWAGIRNQVVHRLVGMNLRHAMHAWNVRRDRAIAPWALGFLYAYPTGTEYDGVELYAVAAAIRLVDHDQELPGPAHLLYRLAAVAHERHRDEHGWYDPTSLCTYRDPVPATATYIGVAVSCLGNRAEPWETLRRGDSDDVPGYCSTLLTDDTTLLLTRAARRDLGRVVMHTTAELTYQRDLTGRRWIAHPDAASMPETDPDLWDQLNRLHIMAGHQNPLPTLEPDPAVGRST